MIAEEQFPPQCEVDISDIVNVHMFGLNGEFLEGEAKKAAQLAYPWPLRVHLNKYRSLECMQMMRSMLVAQGVAPGSAEMHTSPVFFTLFLVSPVQDLQYGYVVDKTGQFRGDNILLATTLGEAMMACGEGHFKRSALEHWLGLMTAPVLGARVVTPMRAQQPVQVDAPRFVRVPELVTAPAVHPVFVAVDASPGGDESAHKAPAPAKRKRYDTVSTEFDTSLNDLQAVMEATFSTQVVGGVRTGTTRDEVRDDFVSIRAKTDTMVRKK